MCARICDGLRSFRLLSAISSLHMEKIVPDATSFLGGELQGGTFHLTSWGAFLTSSSMPLEVLVCRKGQVIEKRAKITG